MGGMAIFLIAAVVEEYIRRLRQRQLPDAVNFACFLNTTELSFSPSLSRPPLACLSLSSVVFTTLPVNMIFLPDPPTSLHNVRLLIQKGGRLR